MKVMYFVLQCESFGILLPGGTICPLCCSIRKAKSSFDQDGFTWQPWLQRFPSASENQPSSWKESAAICFKTAAQFEYYLLFRTEHMRRRTGVVFPCEMSCCIA